ncbi:Spc7-domain-containing protein [Pleomassaria siparia CBS 279.74]|uniref:Spc7-domain-containing protein n=1 Tax=Pleomassaria siparia CBS 279.74 TaxID=1314801 RepID=A0A6G1K9T6_9PLEO|nr:Spc7-domain-containing protein [Pleomassaria siparia CBS 279.74]
MANDASKENIADGLISVPSFKAPSLSPKRPAKKTRSQSIGPGGLAALEQPTLSALKESNGNRRKSAFIPAVKSIIASNDEDKEKRRDARRKSLARRRVSFAPEATLHTWDVVEYMRDATSSTASSEATRRASNITRPSPAPESSDGEEPPSTPPAQAEEPEIEPGSSPANQRDLHQKKRRRSSGIPPMNFNNPDDIFSSSPLRGDSTSPTGSDDAEGSSEDGDNATVKLDNSLDTSSCSPGSAKLDAALRQASAHADTRNLDLNDDDDDVSMELADDNITASFKPWAQKNSASYFDDQENIYPVLPPPVEPDFGEDDDNDMSMDITRAIGKIVESHKTQSPGMDDMSMELTMPLGSIKAPALKESAGRRTSLKRRASLLEASQGSPAKRTSSRRTSLRQRDMPEEDAQPEDETMDFTVAIGSIMSQSLEKQKETASRRNSVNTSFEDETMDFTVAIGSIKDVHATSIGEQSSDMDEDEDLSMEFTNVVGGIKHIIKPAANSEKRNFVKDNIAKFSKPTTPRKSPTKSPERPRRTEPSPSPQKANRVTPKKSPGRPAKVIAPATPDFPAPVQQRIEDFEPSPFVSAVKASVAKSTPTNASRQISPIQIPNDPVTAPILNRRRSSLSLVQFSPLPVAQEPILKSTTILTNNIKLLSTPRKQTLVSPMKRGLTPKKEQTPQKAETPQQKTRTPQTAIPRRSLSPKKRVVFGEQPVLEDAVEGESMEEPGEDVERISLQDFLDMTKIRFMELSTTKRRHTAAPALFHDKALENVEDDSLDRYVVAAACTLPEFELYQHACHEMKKYISDGRHFVRTMEADVMEENPLLFSEYLTAPPSQRAIMDNQFKNLKTSARLEARGEWYGWRSTLLGDLKAGLLSTLDGFRRDESTLTNQEKLLDAVLPPLIEQQGRLETESKQLQQRHDELNSCDREELEQAREQLVTTDTHIAEARRLIAQLQEELAQKEARVEAVKERKIECAEEIKAADRVREECRGWSTKEVNDLKAKVTELEKVHSWSITSASSTAITMTHMNDLELYFQPSAFATGGNTPNASISLSYVGDSTTAHPRPLTTSKRFFLQLIRAHLHCIPQSQTQITDLLSLVKNTWATTLAVAEGVSWLEHSHITEETILSDERMAITANMLLPGLQTKIKATFDIGASIGTNGVETQVSSRAELVYGEKYSEDKMTAFLNDFCGTEVHVEGNRCVWADGVCDLAARLVATGRKGERA